MVMHDASNALEEHTCPNCGCVHTHKFQWDWGKLIVGKIGNKFIAWATYMVLQFILLLDNIIPSEWIGYLLIISGAVTGLFMLAGAIDIAVSKAEIKAQLGVGKTSGNTTGLQ